MCVCVCVCVCVSSARKTQVCASSEDSRKSVRSKESACIAVSLKHLDEIRHL